MRGRPSTAAPRPRLGTRRAARRDDHDNHAGQPRSNPYSHQPTHQRERRRQGCKSPAHAQRFLSAYAPIAQPFRPQRHRLSAPAYRQERGHRVQLWRERTGLAPAASASTRVQRSTCRPTPAVDAHSCDHAMPLCGTSTWRLAHPGPPAPSPTAASRSATSARTRGINSRPYASASASGS